MMTQSHAITALALFGKPGHRARNVAAVVGGLIPDLTMFYMVFFERARGNSLELIFDELYFSDFWQEIFAVNNSAPLFLVIAALGFWFKKSWIWVLGLAAALHALFDLPLHHDDGHPHFWPITNWIYESPVSYWDPKHYGNIVQIIELLCMTALAVFIWRRFSGWFERVSIALLYSSLIVVPLVFYLRFGIS